MKGKVTTAFLLVLSVLVGSYLSVAFAQQGQLQPELPPAHTSEQLRRREEEHRTLFQTMDKKEGKIGKVIKEYSDPSTSAEKKLKLRTYLRQTTINSAEDKAELKRALLVPDLQDQELQSDIQFALLHAIQEHPEESDASLILELLQTNANALGWLYYAMLSVWDPRFVPYLIQGARSHSDISIEILGRKRIAEAVPVLEEVLRSAPADSHVWGDAWTALFQITGKKYPH